MTRVLFIVSAADGWTLKDGTVHPTGFWAEELVVPHQTFVEAGWDVTGVHLKLADTPGHLQVQGKGCCTLADADDARRVAGTLGIPFYVWDMAEEFQRAVVDDFAAEYAGGRTPNPCARCNEQVKVVGLLARARARMPDVRVAGDMIVGFCGETDADHAASLTLLRQTRYKNCYVFKYSQRSGTQASRRLPDDVPEAVKKERNVQMLAVQQEISLMHHRALIGQEVEVLVEGFNPLRAAPAPQAADGLVQLGRDAIRPTEAVPQAGEVRLMGRTMGDELVAFNGQAAWVGERRRVRGVAATPLTLLGAAL